MNSRLGRYRVRWSVATPICILGLVFLLLMARHAERVDVGAPREDAAGAAGGRLYLAPTGVGGRYHLLAADTDPQSAQTAGIFRAFGRRASDGLALEASVVITVPGDLALVGSDPEPALLHVLGQEVDQWVDPRGVRSLTWGQRDGTTAAAMTWGVSEPDLIALAASLLPGDAARDAPALPAGFAPIHSGVLSGGVPMVSVQNWQADDGTEFGVSVVDVPGVTFEDLGWYLPGGHATQVRATMGVYSSSPDSALTWLERPGVVVTMQGVGIAERDLLAIAENLRPIDEAGWKALMSQMGQAGNGAPPSRFVTALGPVKVLTGANRYFVIRPVEQRLFPPCAAGPSRPSAEVVAETRDGREVACYQVGSPLVAADDVTKAMARRSPAGDGWEVEFTVTSEGAARFQALLQDVRSSHLVAILVDDRLVSLPRVASGAEPSRGVVNGLDEQTARHLAERLERER